MEEYKYKEALERAKSSIKECGNNLGRIKMIESIFPELKESEESEDEKIRKALLNKFTHLLSKGCNKFAGLENEDIITWLEKQDEKPITVKVDGIDAITDFPTEFEKQVSCFAASIINREYDYNYNLIKWAAKGLLGYAKHELEKQGKQSKEVIYTHEVETGNGNIRALVTEKVQLPKFKVGDWVVNNVTHNLCHIVKAEHGQYICDDCSFPINKENEYHPWSIADAKPGDVLASSRSIFIFKGIYMADKPEAYCGVWNDFSIETYEGCWTNERCYPATKEQQRLLFEKITEAGYEWKEKVLNKIKMQDLVTSEDNVTKISDQDPDKLIEESYQQQADDLIDMVTEKSAWSEEDNNNLRDAIVIIDRYRMETQYADTKKICLRCLDWLRSIKQRLS